MAREIKNAQCGFYHTKYCDLLHMASCDSCPFCNRQEDCEKIREDLDVLMALMPEGGIHTLFDTDTCQLCKGEEKNRAECYALVDMGHKEPTTTKRNGIGMKVTAKMGSLLPVQIACCKTCRRRLLLLEYLPVVLPLAAGVVTLIIMSMDGVNEALKQIGWFMPLFTFAGMTALYSLAGKLLKKNMQQQWRTKTVTNLLEIPKLAQMKEKGWFALNTRKNGEISPVFLNKRLQTGVGSGTPGDALAEER